MSHAHHAHAVEVRNDAQFGKASIGKLAMWIFLVTDAMSFSGFLLAYAVVRSTTAWPDPAQYLGINLSGFATFILICSSVSMVLSIYRVAEREDRVDVGVRARPRRRVPRRYRASRRVDRGEAIAGLAADRLEPPADVDRRQVQRSARREPVELERNRVYELIEGDRIEARGDVEGAVRTDPVAERDVEVERSRKLHRNFDRSKSARPSSGTP